MPHLFRADQNAIIEFVLEYDKYYDAEGFCRFPVLDQDRVSRYNRLNSEISLAVKDEGRLGCI